MLGLRATGQGDAVVQAGGGLLRSECAALARPVVVGEISPLPGPPASSMQRRMLSICWLVSFDARRRAPEIAKAIHPTCG